MPKFSISATELTNTDVNFVALVKRGANRIPFRITKSEETDMIDLHSIGARLFKREQAEPQLVAVIVEKAADAPKVVATLKSAGLDVTAFVKSETDGLVTLAKADTPMKDVMLVKCAGGVALAYTGLTKAFDGYDFQSPDFGDVHAKGAHTAAVSTAKDMLHRAVQNINETADSPKDAADKIGAACDAHKAHVTAMTKKLPTSAFKADEALLKMTGNPVAAGGTNTDQQTETGLSGDGKIKKSSDGKELADEGDPAKKDPEMPVKKADAGKNGTGAGVELGEGTGTNGSATTDDADNTEVDAKPGAAVSGDSSGLPAKLKSPTQKEEAKMKSKAQKVEAVAVAQLAVAKAELAVAVAKSNTFDADCDGDDDSVMTGESAAGEGAAQAIDTRDKVSDEDVTGAAVTGKVKGATLDMSGIPAKLKAPTAKNDGDAEIGKKGAGKTVDDDLSGAGAQETNVQALKEDVAANIMKAVQALSKTTGEAVAALTKQVEAVAVMAKKNDAALNGTVFNEAGGDNVRAIKAEGSGAPPLMDTGFSRRTA